MPNPALTQGDHRGMGGGVFLTPRTLRADEGSYRLPRFPALSRFPFHSMNSDNLDNAVTLGLAVGYQVTEVTAFVTFRQRGNIDRARAFGFRHPCAS